MKKSILLGIILMSFIVVVGGCPQLKVDTKKIAQNYLEYKGYNVLSYIKQSDQPRDQTYKLSKELLVKLAYADIWYLQKVHPNDYLGKTIYMETFEVNNHPLDSFRFSNNDNEHIIYKNKTITHVMVVDGEVIGGYSYPIFEYDDPKNSIMGFSWFTLDGKRLGEIKPNNDRCSQGKTYDEWLEDWLGYSRKTLKSTEN